MVSVSAWQVWLVAALLLFVAEVLAPGFWLLSVAVGCVLAGAVSLVVPGYLAPVLSFAAGTLLSLLSSVLELRIHRGDVDGARHVLSLFARIERSPDIQCRACLAGSKSVIDVASGDPRRALTSGLEGVDLAEQLGIASQAVKQAFVASVEAAIAIGDMDQANGLLERVEMLKPGERPPLLVAQTSRFRARMAGDDSAESGFKSAAGLFRELGTPFWLAVTLLEYGVWLVDRGRVEDARPFFEEARGTFQRLNAEPWLERLEKTATAVRETSGPTPGTVCRRAATVAIGAGWAASVSSRATICSCTQRQRAWCWAT